MYSPRFTGDVHVPSPTGSLRLCKSAFLGSGFLLRPTSCIHAVVPISPKPLISLPGYVLASSSSSRSQNYTLNPTWRGTIVSIGTEGCWGVYSGTLASWMTRGSYKDVFTAVPE
jgi:hypothetical protein